MIFQNSAMTNESESGAGSFVWPANQLQKTKYMRCWQIQFKLLFNQGVNTTLWHFFLKHLCENYYLSLGKKTHFNIFYTILKLSHDIIMSWHQKSMTKVKNTVFLPLCITNPDIFWRRCDKAMTLVLYLTFLRPENSKMLDLNTWPWQMTWKLENKHL